jgi:F-type H+-transporting ATPase subunit b
MRTVMLTISAWALAAVAGENAHAAEAGEHAPPLLSADPGTAIWTLILFLIVLTVLGKLVWPPIVKGLAAREQKVRGEIEAAEAANRNAKQTLAEYEKKLAEAHAEARRLIEQAKGDAEKVRQRLAAETETEIARMRDRATTEIRQAKSQAVQELYSRAAELSITIAEKVLERNITDADTQSLVDRSLRELDEVRV